MQQQANSLFEHQLKLEKLYDKNQAVKRIHHEFTSSEIDFEGFFLEHNVDVDFGYDLLTQMVLHKRATLPTLVGILRKHFSGPTASQKAADMLQLCAALDLVDWSPTTEQFVIRINITDDVQADIDRFQYPLPMVIRPRHVRNNRDTGYLLTRNSIILKKNYHEDDVCLDHINRVNRIRFEINFDTASMIANRWRNLDKPKEGETKQDFDKRVRAFEKYDRTAKEVITQLLAHGNSFFLTHKYDKRGRVYCQGYHVNYQGAPWNKAVIELADKELVE
jgi:hypothetical protein